MWCRRALTATLGRPRCTPTRRAYLLHGLGYAGQDGRVVRHRRGRPGTQPDDPLPAVAQPAQRSRPAPAGRETTSSPPGTTSASVARRGGCSRAFSTPPPLRSPTWPGPSGWPAAGGCALVHAESGQWPDQPEESKSCGFPAFGRGRDIRLVFFAATGPRPSSSSPTWPGTQGSAKPGYERSSVAIGHVPGPASGRPAATRRRWMPPHSRRCESSGNRDAVDEPGFWPWQDLLRRRAGRPVSRFSRPNTFLVPHEELAARAAAASAIARLAQRPGHRVEAAASPTGERRARLHRALDARTEGPSAPLRAGPDRAGRRAAPTPAHGQRRRRAADLPGGRRPVHPQLGAGALRRAVRRR